MAYTSQHLDDLLDLLVEAVLRESEAEEVETAPAAVVATNDGGQRLTSEEYPSHTPPQAA